MEPLAKPSGIALADHRDHVVREAERLLGLHPDETPGLPFLAEKYRTLTGESLADRVRSAAWHHDKGKEHPLWQRACREDHGVYRAWRLARRLDPDAVDAEDYARFQADRRRRHEGRRAGEALMRSGVRHEFASLAAVDRNPGLRLSLAERVAVAAHHGKLGARHEHRWTGDAGGEFAALWSELTRASSEGRAPSDPPSLDHRLLQRYELAGVRALLRLADTRASRAEAGGALPPVVPFRYEFNPEWTPRPVQRLALDHADDPVTVLRAPTGSGKTAAARLWARHQVERGRADRLVVAMPTRFTANALAAGLGESVSQAGLTHSSAWHARFGHLDRRSPEHDLAREHHALARLLVTPQSVCTVDHLLIALTGTREDHHATFFFLANAAVAFDEVDFYDPFVQANLVVLLRALRTLGVPVLLMSATVPESARTLYAVPTPVREPPPTDDDRRARRTLHRRGPAETPADAADVLDRMVEGGAGIVYANTVERAYRYWEYLRERTDDVYLYHSRYTEPDKKTIEDALVGVDLDEDPDGPVGALGRQAWERGEAHGIAVLTQIGEMSVNVSAPLMLSDLCPWDRLAQRAGRLARFTDLAPDGDLYVVDPARGGDLYPAPYGEFLGPTAGWVAGEPLLQTRARLDVLTSSGPLRLTPDLLVREVDALYPEAAPPDARAQANVDELRRMIRDNWMIVPQTEARDDDATVPGRWQSRDIPAQKVLLVLGEDELPEGDRPLRLSSLSDLYRLQLEAGVACPHYLIERGVRRGDLSLLRYTLGDDPDVHTAFLCVRGYDRPDDEGPDRGRGSGLGALSAREAEDSFDRVAL